jgi:hypothetical protein
MHKLTIDCDPISYNDRSKLCHALIAEGYSFEENNEKNTVTVLGASLSRFPYKNGETMQRCAGAPSALGEWQPGGGSSRQSPFFTI